MFLVSQYWGLVDPLIECFGIEKINVIWDALSHNLGVDFVFANIDAVIAAH